jgi:hypothetical protein
MYRMVFVFSKASPAHEPRGKSLLTELATLTVFLGLGVVLFLLPAWVVPHHDSIGVGWFFAFPVGMLRVLVCRIRAWPASGKVLVAGSVAGLSLWLLVAATVVI